MSSGSITERRLPVWRLVTLVALALVASCSSSTTPSSPNGMFALSGNGQYVSVGTSTPHPLVVLVVDQDNNPFTGADVAWVVKSGAGQLSATTTASDANGLAQVTYTAGAAARTDTITATAAGFLSVGFVVHVGTAASASRSAPLSLALLRSEEGSR